MARRVADVRAGLLAVAGAHVRDPLALPVELTEPAPGAVLRVAVVADPPGCDTDPGIAAAIRATADLLAAAGHVVEEVVPASYERTGEVWGGLLMTDLRALRPLLDDVMGDGGRTFLEFGMTGTPEFDTAGLVTLHLERNAIELEWHAFLSEWDVLLSPTWPQPAFDHGADIASVDGALAAIERLRPVVPANLLGLPAAVVPCGVAGGLPVGAQFTARRFADLTALAGGAGRRGRRRSADPDRAPSSGDVPPRRPRPPRRPPVRRRAARRVGPRRRGVPCRPAPAPRRQGRPAGVDGGRRRRRRDRRRRRPRRRPAGRAGRRPRRGDERIDRRPEGRRAHPRRRRRLRRRVEHAARRHPGRPLAGLPPAGPRRRARRRHQGDGHGDVADRPPGVRPRRGAGRRRVARVARRHRPAAHRSARPSARSCSAGPRRRARCRRTS